MPQIGDLDGGACHLSLRAHYRTGSEGQRRVGSGAISARLPASTPVDAPESSGGSPRPALGGPTAAVLHAIRIPPDLAPRHRHHRDVVRVEDRDLQAVALERDPARVRVVAVDLDGESQVGPEEVDLVTGDDRVRFVARDVARPEQAKEGALAGERVRRGPPGRSRTTRRARTPGRFGLRISWSRSSASLARRRNCASATIRSSSSRGGVRAGGCLLPRRRPSAAARSRIVRGGLVSGMPCSRRMSRRPRVARWASIPGRVAPLPCAM